MTTLCPPPDHLRHLTRPTITRARVESSTVGLSTRDLPGFATRWTFISQRDPEIPRILSPISVPLRSGPSAQNRHLLKLNV